MLRAVTGPKEQGHAPEGPCPVVEETTGGGAEGFCQKSLGPLPKAESWTRGAVSVVGEIGVMF